MPKDSRFARELNTLFEDNSLSVENFVTTANMYGLPVSRRTVTYWREGYFLPRSDSAFQLISVLEGIYGIRDNRLSNALLLDLSSGSSFIPGASVQPHSLVATTPPLEHKYSEHYETSEKNIDWEANLIQKVIRDEVYVSADRLYTRYKATVLAQVPAAPDPTFVFQVLYEPGERPSGDEYVYGLSGITVRKQEIYEQDGVTICATRFALTEDVVPGDLHTLSYSWDACLPAPREKESERFLPWVLDFYSSQITFEGGVPDGIRYATFEVHDDKEVEVPCDIPLTRQGNTVSISAKNFGNIAAAFCC